VLLSDPKTFAELKAVKEGGVRDPLLARQIEVLYLQYLGRQVDPELLKQILAVSNATEQGLQRLPAQGRRPGADRQRHAQGPAGIDRFGPAAGGMGGGQGRGPGRRADVEAARRLRNQAARKLGFHDSHVMQLELNEQSQEQVLKLLDELDRLTREPFHAVKAEFDAELAKCCGISAAELRPWHYHDPFFQEAPGVTGVDFDAPYARIDTVKMCRDFYAGIGLPADDVLQRSDLFEKKGKNPQAFSTDIDRVGDVRVLANVVPGRRWAGHHAPRAGARRVLEEPPPHAALRVAHRVAPADD